MKKILSFILIILMICPLTLAHPGRTDGKGGHYNRSTGEYHYHHGYPPHDHENGICPYDYDDNTNSNSLTSNSSTNKIANSTVNEEKKTTVGEILSGILLFILFGIPYIISIAYFPIMVLYLIWQSIKNKFNKK